MYIYIHGFNSAPASTKACQLEARLAALGRAAAFSCPALSHWPETAMQQIEAEVARAPASEITLVGSSLGGFYAIHLAERHGCRAVLVNPAVSAHIGLESYLGPQQNLYTAERYELTREHLAWWDKFSVEQPTMMERYFLMVTSGDEVLDYRAAVERFSGAKQRVVTGSDHGFAEFGDYLDEVLAFGDARL